VTIQTKLHNFMEDMLS